MGATQQALIVGAAASFVGVLDAYTSNLFFAGGDKRMLTSWTGSLYRIRESGGNTETDIGYLSNGADDQSAVSTFCGVNSGYIVKVYDQTGGGNHFTAPSSGTQPLYYNGSTFGSGFLFDGSDDSLLCDNNGSANTAKSIFRNFNGLSGNGKAAFEYGDASLIGSSGDYIQDFINNSTNSEEIYIGHGGGYSQLLYTDPQTSPVGIVLLKGASPGYAGIKRYSSSALITAGTGTDTTGGGATGSFSAAKWRLGRRTDGLALTHRIRRFVIYESDKSSDAVAITAAIA